MVCIGAGPGPKNVLAERDDGHRLVVPYAIWKHKLSKEGEYTGSLPRDESRGGKRMTVVVGIIESVEVKDTKNGDCWEAELSDGTTVATFDEEIGDALEELEGKPAKLEVTVSKNGRYTNRYVDSVEEADEDDVDEKKSSKKSSSRSKGKATGGASKRSKSDDDEQKEERIARAVAVHSIGRMTKPGTDPDFEAMEALTAYILTGETP